MSEERNRSRASSISDVATAVEPTKWAILHAAIVHGLVFGTELLQVAQESSAFSGKAPAAHGHAEKLVRVGVLERIERNGRLAFRATDSGRVLHAHITAITTGDVPEDAQHATETRILAVVARIAAGEYDAMLTAGDTGYELFAELRENAARIAATHAQIQVTRTPPAT